MTCGWSLKLGQKPGFSIQASMHNGQELYTLTKFWLYNAKVLLESSARRVWSRYNTIVINRIALASVRSSFSVRSHGWTTLLTRQLHCLVRKIHCLSNQNKPDNGQWHMVSHTLFLPMRHLWWNYHAWKQLSVISGSNQSVWYQFHNSATKNVLIGKIKTKDYCKELE